MQCANREQGLPPPALGELVVSVGGGRDGRTRGISVWGEGGIGGREEVGGVDPVAMEYSGSYPFHATFLFLDI